jgi:hypothetical protein
VVCYAFCGLQVGHWVEGDDAFKNHSHWSPFCGFVNGVVVGNIPSPSKTSQQQPSSNCNVRGPYMEYTPKTTCPECCKYIYIFTFLFPHMYNYNSTLIHLSSLAVTKFRQHNELQWDSPMYPYYSYRART